MNPLRLSVPVNDVHFQIAFEFLAAVFKFLYRESHLLRQRLTGLRRNVKLSIFAGRDAEKGDAVFRFEFNGLIVVDEFNFDVS